MAACSDVCLGVLNSKSDRGCGTCSEGLYCRVGHESTSAVVAGWALRDRHSRMIGCVCMVVPASLLG